MIRLESACKYMLPCGLCELKKEPCSMSFNNGLKVTTVPFNDQSCSTVTDPFMNPSVTAYSSAQENKDITV